MTTYAFLKLGIAGFLSVFTFVMNTLGAGGIILGHVVHDTSLTDSPSTFVNSGATVTYAGEDDVAGGGKRLTISGSYTRAEVQVPSFYQSGAYLRQVTFECGRTPVALSGTLAIKQYTKQAYTAGTVLRRNILVGTGGVTIANTGAVITTKIPADYYIAFTGSGGKALGTNSLVGTDCVMKPELREKYGR